MVLKILGHPIKQSQKITVTRDEKDPQEYTASIEYSGPRGLSITLPMRNQSAMELKRGEEVFLKVITESSILEFKSRVKSLTTDNIILVNLENPTDFKRVQRRSSFRLKTVLSVQIAPVHGDGEKEPRFVRATALDISAGGMEVVARFQCQKDDLLLVKFDLELDKKTVFKFLVEARVRRITQESATKYKLGLEFQNLSDKDTDKIYRYIFKKSAAQEFWRK